MNLTTERVSEEAAVLEESLHASLSFPARLILSTNDRAAIKQALVDATLSFRPKRRKSNGLTLGSVASTTGYAVTD